MLMQAKSWEIVKNYPLAEMENVCKRLFQGRKIALTYSYFIFSRNYSISEAVYYLHQLGAGLSASRRAWERVPLHELSKTINNQII